MLDAVRIDESCLILGDVELPFHHADFINNCIRLAKHWRIDTLILAGDFIHWASLAFFPDSEKDVEKEIEQIGLSIRPFIESFSKVVWISGNHEKRVTNAMDRLLSLKYTSRLIIPSDLAELFKARVTTSDYFYCWVGQNWKIIHPKATNTVPANAARNIAERQECNVIMTHDHLVGVQQAG